MANKKKVATTAVALTTAAALLLGGTFAWQSISQRALNEASDVINPGGRLHNDMWYETDDTTNSNIYVENFTDPEGGDDIYARVRLGEYMEIVMNYGSDAEKVETVAGSKTPVKDSSRAADDATAQNQYDYTYTTHYFHQTNATDAYWTWDTDGSDAETTYYMPTFNKNKDSLVPDLNGLYRDRVGGISNREAAQYVDVNGNSLEGYEGYTVNSAAEEKYAIYDVDSNQADELGTDPLVLAGYINNGTGADVNAVTLVQETHSVAEVGATSGLKSLEWWLTEVGYDATTGEAPKYEAAEHGDYWVYDTDGWVYWTGAIGAGKTTGLLLDSFTLKDAMDDTWYYAIEAKGEFITADDLGEYAPAAATFSLRSTDAASPTDLSYYNGGTGFYANGISQNALALLRIIGVDVDGKGTDDGEAKPEAPKTVDVTTATENYPEIHVNVYDTLKFNDQLMALEYEADGGKITLVQNQQYTMSNSDPTCLATVVLTDETLVGKKITAVAKDATGTEYRYAYLIVDGVAAKDSGEEAATFEVRVTDNADGTSWTTVNGKLTLSPSRMSGYVLSVANSAFSAADYTWAITEDEAVMSSELTDYGDGTYGLHTNFDEHDGSYVVVTVTEKKTGTVAATVKIILDENDQYADPAPDADDETKEYDVLLGSNDSKEKLNITHITTLEPLYLGLQDGVEGDLSSLKIVGTNGESGMVELTSGVDYTYDASTQMLTLLERDTRYVVYTVLDNTGDNWAVILYTDEITSPFELRNASVTLTEAGYYDLTDVTLDGAAVSVENVALAFGQTGITDADVNILPMGVDTMLVFVMKDDLNATLTATVTYTTEASDEKQTITFPLILGTGGEEEPKGAMYSGGEVCGKTLTLYKTANYFGSDGYGIDFSVADLTSGWTVKEDVTYKVSGEGVSGTYEDGFYYVKSTTPTANLTGNDSFTFTVTMTWGEETYSCDVTVYIVEQTLSMNYSGTPYASGSGITATVTGDRVGSSGEPMYFDLVGSKIKVNGTEYEPIKREYVVSYYTDVEWSHANGIYTMSQSGVTVMELNETTGYLCVNQCHNSYSVDLAVRSYIDLDGDSTNDMVESIITLKVDLP